MMVSLAMKRMVFFSRMMNEVQVRYDLAKMIDQYLRVYEKLNGGEPLT